MCTDSVSPKKEIAMMERISTQEAPQAIGPYSQAVIATKGSDFIFVSGQLPVDPKTGRIVDGDIRCLTKQVIDNIEAILKAANSRLDLVVRTDVFLKDLKDFAAMNAEYASRFCGEVMPARQTIQVAELPMGARIEISCIAVRK